MKRSTLILIALFVLLLAAALLVMERPGERSSASSVQGPLVEFDSAAVTRITVNGSFGSVTVEKRGVEWFVTAPISYRADKAAVEGLLHQSKTLMIRNVVSTRPEKHAVFQTDSTGTAVHLFAAGTETASFILGKMGTSYTESYARKSSADEVVLIDGMPGPQFNKPLRDWRDRTILSLAPASVTEMRFQYGDTIFVLSRPDSLWMVGGKRAKQEAVLALLNTLAAFRADDFADTVAKAPPVRAQISIGTTEMRFAFDPVRRKQLVQTSAGPQWYVLEAWTASNVLKRRKDFLD